MYTSQVVLVCEKMKVAESGVATSIDFIYLTIWDVNHIAVFPLRCADPSSREFHTFASFCCSFTLCVECKSDCINRLSILFSKSFYSNKSRLQLSAGPKPTMDQVDRRLLEINFTNCPPVSQFSAFQYWLPRNASGLNDKTCRIFKTLFESDLIIFLKCLNLFENEIVNILFISHLHIFLLQECKLLTQSMHEYIANRAIMFSSLSFRFLLSFESLKNPAFRLQTVDVFLGVGILCTHFRRRWVIYLLVLGKRIGETVFANVAWCRMWLTHFRKFEVTTSVGAENGSHRTKLLYMSYQVVQMHSGLSFSAVVRAVKEHTCLNFVLVVFTYVLVND